MADRTYVIVGASLAGAKAAEALRDVGLRRAGACWSATSGSGPTSGPRCPRRSSRATSRARRPSCTRRAGTPSTTSSCGSARAVTALHRDEHEVELAGGERLGYDKVLLATGSSPRRLEVPGGDLDGIHYLRRLGESEAAARRPRRRRLAGRRRRRLDRSRGRGRCPAPRRRTSCCVEPQPTPLYGVLGREVGEVFADLHRRHGVDLRTGLGVDGFEGEDGRVTGVRTSDGDRARGVPGGGRRGHPAQHPPRRAGRPRGRQRRASSTSCCRPSDPDVYAAGDVANAWNPLLRAPGCGSSTGPTPPTRATAAGRSMAGQGEPYAKLPYFFTDQYDLSMEYHGYVATGRGRRRWCCAATRGPSRAAVARVLARRRPGPGRHERQRLGRRRRHQAAGAGPGRRRPGPAGRPRRTARRGRRTTATEWPVVTDDLPRVVTASSAWSRPTAGEVFELVADPAQQPRWDGNDNLDAADPGQRVRAVGDVFRMRTTKGNVRENHVVEFEEGRRIAWRPAEPGAGAARPPLALGARAGRRRAHPGHAHLRLDPAHRRAAPAARPRHHGAQRLHGVGGPAGRARRVRVGRPRQRGSSASTRVCCIQRAYAATVHPASTTSRW